MFFDISLNHNCNFIEVTGTLRLTTGNEALKLSLVLGYLVSSALTVHDHFDSMAHRAWLR